MDIKARLHNETLKGHGRLDEITYYQMPVQAALVNRKLWAGLMTIDIAIHFSQRGEVCTSEVRYCIRSIAMGVKRFASFVRGHRAIKNTLHWCLELPFKKTNHACVTATQST